MVSRADGAARDAELRSQVALGGQAPAWLNDAVKDGLTKAPVNLFANRGAGRSIEPYGQLGFRGWVIHLVGSWFYRSLTRTHIGSVMKTSNEHVDEATAGHRGGGDRDARKGGTSLYGATVEYGLHSLLWLLDDEPRRASSRDLADMQGVPAAMLSKIMPKLEKAGIVTSTPGIAGGYELARPAAQVSVLEVVDAIEGDRKLFDCREVRRGCALFGEAPPAWSVSGVCGIHAVMIRAERQMRAELAKTSLADLVRGVRRPAEFEVAAAGWFRERGAARETARLTAVRDGRRRHSRP